MPLEVQIPPAQPVDRGDDSRRVPEAFVQVRSVVTVVGSRQAFEDIRSGAGIVRKPAPQLELKTVAFEIPAPRLVAVVDMLEVTAPEIPVRAPVEAVDVGLLDH